MERIVNMLCTLVEIYKKTERLEDPDSNFEILRNKAEFNFYLSLLGKIDINRNPENSQIKATSLFHIVQSSNVSKYFQSLR